MSNMRRNSFNVSDLDGTGKLSIPDALREEGGMRLDLFLKKRLPWLSRSAIRILIDSGSVSGKTGRLTSRAVKGSSRVAEGDGFEVSIPGKLKDKDEAERNPPLSRSDFLYDDEFVLAVNKPAGVPVHPVGRNLHRTVLTALHRLFCVPDDADKDVVVTLAHRLDLETSGVLLAAKDRVTLSDLAKQFRARTIKKEYMAVVYGNVADDIGEVDLPVGHAEDSRVPYKRAVRKDGGDKAVTRFEVVKRRSGLTMVRLQPLTGRKHQLRVHMAALGHPVVGDKIYGPDEKYYFMAREAFPGPEELKELLLPRQALHSFRLTFRHPMNGKRIRIEAPVPDELAALVEGTRLR